MYVMPQKTPSSFDYDAALAGCAAGRRESLRQLYEQEGARLLGVAQRIVRDTGQAEDIVHDAFLQVWTRAGSFDPALGSARGWVYSITRNLALNAVRDRREQVMDDDTTQALEAREALEAWRGDAALQTLRDGASRIGFCLEKLDPERRHCILHAYVDGLSHGEIARRLGAPLGTVKAWIKRSLQALRECLA
ncbi:RNA polymerase sigma factor [plant metagenome]|uniref:RNA polymerase sigma factor n=1 Tax=plant metagenome TaxID=1297885 RepID=A0A484S3G5_9ZZZZ